MVSLTGSLECGKGLPDMDLSNLKHNQFALGFIEATTGIVLDLDGHYHTGASERYVVFECLEDAEKEATSRVTQHPNIHCIIFDSTGRMVGEVQKGGF